MFLTIFAVLAIAIGSVLAGQCGATRVIGQKGEPTTQPLGVTFRFDPLDQSQHQWRLKGDLAAGRYVLHGCCELVNGKVVTHSGGGSKSRDTAQWEFAWRHEADKLVMSRKPGGTLESVWPEGAELRVTAKSDDVTLHPDRYTKLWQGDFVKDGHILKSVYYLARLADDAGMDTGFLTQQDPASRPTENAEMLDQVRRLMRQVRIVDDPESAIRAALPTEEHSRLAIQRVEKGTSPWHREAGKGAAYYIGRPLEDLPRLSDGSVDHSRIKQEYRLVLWIMPPDYQGRPQPPQQPSPVGRAALILSAANGKVYASYGPTDEAVALLDAIAPLPDTLIQRRDAMLAEADRIMRLKLIERAAEFPQLKQSARFDDLSRASGNGQIAVSLANPTRASKSGNATADRPEDTFGVRVYLRPARMEIGQMVTYGLLPNLRLAGQIGSSAADPKLDEALKKIVDDALQPLRQLNDAVGR